MHFEDEKDYLMRIMKEAISVLFSFLLGKTYVSVELERENHYQVSGRDLNGLLEMIDQGQINEAENSGCRHALLSIFIGKRGKLFKTAQLFL